MLVHIRRAVILVVASLVLTFAYAYLGTGVSQVLFKHQADGSITANGWLSTALDLSTASGTQEATVTPLTNQGHSFRVVWSRAQL